MAGPVGEAELDLLLDDVADAHHASAGDGVREQKVLAERLVVSSAQKQAQRRKMGCGHAEWIAGQWRISSGRIDNVVEDKNHCNFHSSSD